MMKRIILYIGMLFASAPLFAYDFSAALGKGDSLYYNIISDSTVEVTYDVKVNTPTRFNFDGHIVIPATVTHGGKNYRVTKIGDMAFRYCPLIDSVTIPEGVESIGKFAFQKCTSLQWVNPFSASLREVGESAFNNCKLLEVCFTGPSCNIGSNAFAGCIQLREVTLPRTHANLGYQCFHMDSNLCRVQMPDSMEIIPAGCFMDCILLKSIVIPSGVKLIDCFAFRHCHSLVCCDFNTPSTLDSIANAAFLHDRSLLQMDLSQTKIRTLSISVFEDCVRMKELKLPNTLKVVGRLSINGDTSLVYFILPSSVEYVSDRHRFDGDSSVSLLFKEIFKPTNPPRWFRFSLDDRPGGDTASYKDTIYVPCGYVQTYRSANDKNWYIVKTILEIDMVEEEIILDSVCGRDVQQKYGFYPDHSGVYCKRVASSFACDSMAIFRISLATPPLVYDSTIQVEVNLADTSLLWTWEGNGVYYDVLRDGDYIATVKEPAYLDTNIRPDVQYCYNFVPWGEYCEGLRSTTNCYTMVADSTSICQVRDQRLTIHPNPAREVIFVGVEGHSPIRSIDGTNYEITDITGRIVIQGHYNVSEGIPVVGLARGMYLLRMEGIISKFVKE